ncbi:MAG: hypothetical protein MR605_07085 [Bacteroidales bacterium]|nr:hypothetical protein [Bacteroidales bacterium]
MKVLYTWFSGVLGVKALIFKYSRQKGANSLFSIDSQRFSAVKACHSNLSQAFTARVKA